MSEELREQVARRLCDAFNDEADRINAEEKETGVPWPERYKYDTSLLWRAVADEVIRIAEWARQQALSQEGVLPYRGSLTLPPPGLEALALRESDFTSLSSTPESLSLPR